jgi:hypothetical protein
MQPNESYGTARGVEAAIKEAAKKATAEDFEMPSCVAILWTEYP